MSSLTFKGLFNFHVLISIPEIFRYPLCNYVGLIFDNVMLISINIQVSFYFPQYANIFQDHKMQLTLPNLKSFTSFISKQ